MSVFHRWLCGVGLLLIGLTVGAVEVTVAYGEYPFAPYQMGKGPRPADPPGLAVELVMQSAAQLGIDVKLRRMPVKRILHLLENGHLDGAIGYSYTPDRAEFLIYPRTAAGSVDGSKQLYTIEYYLFSRPDFIPQGLDNGLAGLASYRVGVASGSSISQVLDSQGIRYEAARTPEQDLAKLLSRRLDLVLGPNEPTSQLINSLGWKQQIRRFGEPLLAREYYLVFNKSFCREYGSLCERWWHEIQQRRDALFAEKANDYR